MLTSINLEYIAEQQEFVARVTGATAAETVPQSFVESADEVVVVDAPPRWLEDGDDADGDTRSWHSCRSCASARCC